ncbi:hypothetical protein YC2023_116677 [Brassica napus]
MIKALKTESSLIGLYGILADILSLASSFEYFSFHWISRMKNAEADKLAKQVLSAELVLMATTTLSLTCPLITFFLPFLIRRSVSTSLNGFTALVTGSGSSNSCLLCDSTSVSRSPLLKPQNLAALSFSLKSHLLHIGQLVTAISALVSIQTSFNGFTQSPESVSSELTGICRSPPLKPRILAALNFSLKSLLHHR